MVISVSEDGNITTNQIVGKRLKGLLKRAIDEGRYSSHKDFFDRLNDRLEKIESVEKSTHVNVNNPNTYAKYLNGGTTMKLYVFREICRELDCSPAYLLGLTVFNNDPSGTILKFINSLGDGVTIERNWENEDEIYINYHGTELYLDRDTLTKKVQELVDCALFLEAKKVKK